MTEKIKPRLPVVICDPGCRDKRGHHYEFKTSFKKKLKSLNASQTSTQKYLNIKVFYHSPYSIVPADINKLTKNKSRLMALIAGLSSHKICIIQHASPLLIQALHTIGQCCWENIVIPFPQSPASDLAEIEPKLQICYDRWFKPAFGATKPYFYFPRSRFGLRSL